MLPKAQSSDRAYPVKIQPYVVRCILEHRWLVLGAWLILISALHVPQHGWSWHFVPTGVHALFSPAPLSLYAQHPELQMGPLTFVVAAPFVLLLHGVVGEVAGMLLMLAVGLVIVREVRIISVGRDTEPDLRWFVTALLLLSVWAELAVHWGHLDDALAMLGGVVGLRLVREGHPVGAAIAFGLAVDFKPWALPFAVLLFLAPRRQWAAVATACAVVVCAGWLPFILGDPGTLTALKFGIPVDAASTLHLFDSVARTTPRWDRYAQALIAIVVAAIAIWRRRWASVLLIVVAIRLLLDPATKNYYDAGLTVGTAVFDVAAGVGLLPIVTIGSILLVYVPSYALATQPETRGIVRTIGLVLILATTFLAPMRSNSAPRVTSTQDDLVTT